MENIIGQNFKQFRNVVIRNSVIYDNVVVGDDCFITNSRVGNNCTVERRGMVFNSVLGDYSYTGYNSVIKHANIGKFCSISWNVSIGGANHELSHLTTHPFPIRSKYGFVNENHEYVSFDSPLTIGNDVWIGSNVCVLRGVTIGDGAVIGAGAVVTHDISPYEIWAGIPAVKIGQRFSGEVKDYLLKHSWYEYPEEFIKANVDMFREDVTLDLLEELSYRYKVYKEEGK